jgi:hypothetical protein
MSGTVTTNVPLPVLGPNGYIAPAESVVLAGVQADWNAAFGGSLSFSTTSGSQTNPTPQGQLAASEAAIIGAFNALFLQYVNQVDPAFSSGRMQDGIARIYFISRDPAEPTVVTVTISGLVKVQIPVGALIEDENGFLYSCTNAVTIPAGGSITTTFANNTNGPIACPPQTFTIAKTIFGWDSAISTADGVLGQDVESAADFEFRRANTVAANAVGTLPAILGSVLTVADVIDAFVLDNATNAPVTTGGVTLAANSLYVCVTGGLALAVAKGIWLKKQPGCSYTGNTTETVTDPSPLYTTPPQYQVSFETSTPTVTWFLVNIQNSVLVPSNAQALISAAILNAFVGGDGGARARIGSTVFASRFYAGVAALGTWAQIVSLQLGVQASSFTGSISGTTLTVSGAVTGTIAVGQTLVDQTGLITPGTTIVSGSGTSWQVSASQTVASEPMNTVSMQNSLSYNINQAPTTAANNVVVAV